MADLDDFFAKKDRKKSKTVKKFTTADELSLAKKMEETKIKSDKPKKEKVEGEDGIQASEEEEWREYEEQVKDYSGLKIQVLTAASNNSNEGTCSGDDNDDSVQGKIKGPWNKSENPANQTSGQEASSKPQSEPPQEKQPAYVPYVPPLKRLQGQQEMKKQKQNKNAPDIHNDDYFPVLGANKKPTGGSWTTQPTRGANMTNTTSRPQQVEIGNRFNSLQDS